VASCCDSLRRPRGRIGEDLPLMPHEVERLRSAGAVNFFTAPDRAGRRPSHVRSPPPRTAGADDIVEIGHAAAEKPSASEGQHKTDRRDSQLCRRGPRARCGREIKSACPHAVASSIEAADKPDGAGLANVSAAASGPSPKPILESGRHGGDQSRRRSGSHWRERIPRVQPCRPLSRARRLATRWAARAPRAAKDGCSRRAEPPSHGLAIRKAPGLRCRARNSWVPCRLGDSPFLGRSPVMRGYAQSRGLEWP